ncbi:MAG: helix-turn-helix domain-containing protein [Candidatus Levybacteria bacterium]|nr:helix-turn-helix domain-containing protein [Candidatus Levybacteria bacterium]
MCGIAKKIALQTTENGILRVLVENQELVFNNNSYAFGQLKREIGREDDLSYGALRTHIKNLRHKLGRFGECMVTVPGLGYKFMPPEKVLVSGKVSS